MRSGRTDAAVAERRRAPLCGFGFIVVVFKFIIIVFVALVVVFPYNKNHPG